jgi:hypothetical protein
VGGRTAGPFVEAVGTVDAMWVVVLEAAGGPSSGQCSGCQVQQLLEALDPGPWAGALTCADRYALQVTTTGSSPAEALVDVLSRWRQAVCELGLPPWDVVRTEVLTHEELQHDLEDARRDENGRGAPGRSRGARTT